MWDKLWKERTDSKMWDKLWKERTGCLENFSLGRSGELSDLPPANPRPVASALPLENLSRGCRLSLDQGLRKHQEVSSTPMTKVKKIYCDFFGPSWCKKGKSWNIGLGPAPRDEIRAQDGIILWLLMSHQPDDPMHLKKKVFKKP